MKYKIADDGISRIFIKEKEEGVNCKKCTHFNGSGICKTDKSCIDYSMFEKKKIKTKYYTCFNKSCVNYACMSCSCNKGSFAIDCKDRVETILKEEKIVKIDLDGTEIVGGSIKIIKDNIIPNYYHKGKVDTIQFCLDNDLNFLQGNIIKYVVRYKEKNGLEDLEKAMEYLKRLMDHERK